MQNTHDKGIGMHIYPDDAKFLNNDDGDRTLLSPILKCKHSITGKIIKNIDKQKV